MKAISKMPGYALAAGLEGGIPGMVVPPKKKLISTKPLVERIGAGTKVEGRGTRSAAEE